MFNPSFSAIAPTVSIFLAAGQLVLALDQLAFLRQSGPLHLLFLKVENDFESCSFSNNRVDIENVGLLADIREAHSRTPAHFPDPVRSGRVSRLHCKRDICNTRSHIGYCN